jgi:glycosyltransferase involved in cell wall biosynthesis
VTYKAAVFKTKIERILAYPFVMFGKFSSFFFPLKSHHQLFIFSPSADIGGSIRVNADLCKCLADKSPLVIFSKKPKNNEFIHLFKIEGVRTIDLHRYVDNKLYHFINFFFRGVISTWINKAQHPVIVGGESLFFYKVLPYIKKESRRIDICHLNTWFNYSQAFLNYLDARVFSTEKIKRDAANLYKRNNLPAKYFSRLHFIDNKIDIPTYVKSKNEILSVVYIGRGAPQKRVHLIAAIAKKMFDAKIKIHFSFVGDVEKVVNPSDLPFATFYGNIQDKNKMEKIYQESDVLLLTSAYEGLPLVVMEMMAYGKVIVSTAVGGIPDYIQDGENGFLIENANDENRIVDSGVKVLSNLVGNESLLEKIGEANRKYAEGHFSEQAFCKNYRNVLCKMTDFA